MKLYAIRRNHIPPEMTWTEMDGAVIEILMNQGIGLDEDAVPWEPRVLGVEWVRTYWAPGTNWGLCLYTSPTDQKVKDFHELCDVPYAEIREIDQVEPEAASTDYRRGFHEALEEPPLLAITGTKAGIEDAIVGSNGAVRWIRTYADKNGESATALVEPASASRTDLEADLVAAGFEIRRVVEFSRSDYAGW